MNKYKVTIKYDTKRLYYKHWWSLNLSEEITEVTRTTTITANSKSDAYDIIDNYTNLGALFKVVVNHWISNIKVVSIEEIVNQENNNE